MENGSFQQIAAILALAVGAGVLALRLRQPLIVAFIAVGIAVGPAGFGWVEHAEEGEIALLSTLGISVLLFLVGLKLDFSLVRTTGPVALAAGLAQMAFTAGVGFLIATLLGFDTTTAVYIGVALTFSSTIIIVKLLSDRREIDRLYGRIAVGILIVQDIAVILAMILITATAAGEDAGLTTELLSVLGKGVGFLAAIAVCMRWILPALLPRIAASRELLVLFSIAWAVAVAAAGGALGLSTEVGAFVAGFALASTAYREAIGSRLVSIRDFLLLFFFIELGSRIELAGIGGNLREALILSGFVLIGKPLLVMAVMRAMRYRSKVSFPAGISLAQISEFSLIMVGLGIAVGHIDAGTLALVTLVGLITIGLSTYLILYWEAIYGRLGGVLHVFEPPSPRPEPEPEEAPYDVVVIGAGRYGRPIAERVGRAGGRLLVVDWDPRILSACQGPGIHTLYGDAEDPEMIGSLPLHRLRWVVSTIPNVGASAALVYGLEAAGYEGGVALTAHTRDDAKRLADLAPRAHVLTPFEHGVDPAVELVTASPEDAQT